MNLVILGQLVASFQDPLEVKNAGLPDLKPGGVPGAVDVTAWLLTHEFDEIAAIDTKMWPPMGRNPVLTDELLHEIVYQFQQGAMGMPDLTSDNPTEEDVCRWLLTNEFAPQLPGFVFGG